MQSLQGLYIISCQEWLEDAFARVYSGDFASVQTVTRAVCDSRITEYGGSGEVQGETGLEGDQLSTGMIR
jgi:hypothetical protein